MSPGWEYLAVVSGTYRDKHGETTNTLSIWRPGATEAEKREGPGVSKFASFLSLANELGEEGWELVADEVLTHNAYGSFTHPETGVSHPGFSVVRERARTFKRPLEASWGR